MRRRVAPPAARTASSVGVAGRGVPRHRRRGQRVRRVPHGRRPACRVADERGERARCGLGSLRRAARPQRAGRRAPQGRHAHARRARHECRARHRRLQARSPHGTRAAVAAGQRVARPRAAHRPWQHVADGAPPLLRGTPQADRRRGPPPHRRSGRRPTGCLHDAVSRFEEAAQLDRAWPDPWLGLLRTYIVRTRGSRRGRSRRSTKPSDAGIARAGASSRCWAKPTSHRPNANSASANGCRPSSSAGASQRAAELYRQSVSWFERAPADAETSRALVRGHERRLATSTKRSALACTDASPDD